MQTTIETAAPAMPAKVRRPTSRRAAWCGFVFNSVVTQHLDWSRGPIRLETAMSRVQRLPEACPELWRRHRSCHRLPRHAFICASRSSRKTPQNTPARGVASRQRTNLTTLSGPVATRHPTCDECGRWHRLPRDLVCKSGETAVLFRFRRDIRGKQIRHRKGGERSERHDDDCRHDHDFHSLSPVSSHKRSIRIAGGCRKRSSGTVARSLERAVGIQSAAE